MNLKNITVGMRLFKTMLAIFLCLIIADIRNQYFGGDALVFYSIIATVQCIQKNRTHSIQTALNRMGGTVIGALLGSILLYALMNFDMHPYVSYLIISMAVIPLINTCLIFNIPDGAFTSCTTFFSIVINHGMDVIPYAFAWSRTLDTFWGILIALIANLTFSTHCMKE